MRLSSVPLSLLVHTVAIGGAVVVGGAAVARLPVVAPRVEVQSSPSTTVAPSPTLEPPVVLPEPVEPTSPMLELEETPEFEPAEPLPELVPWIPPAVPRPSWLQAVRRAPAGPVAETEPLVDVPPAAPVPVVEPRARVEASPCADNQPPEYPANDRALGHEGDVIVVVELDADGLVRGVELGRPSPHPGLNRAALQAVRRWRFTPAQDGGRAVPSRLEIPVVFRLLAP